MVKTCELGNILQGCVDGLVSLFSTGGVLESFTTHLPISTSLPSLGKPQHQVVCRDRNIDMYRHIVSVLEPLLPTLTTRSD